MVSRAVRGKPVEGRVQHRITPGSLPVSGPSSCGASPSGLWSSVRLDTCGSPSANVDGDDTSRSPSYSRWRPGLAGVSVGVITPRKSLLELVRLALLARFVLAHG